MKKRRGNNLSEAGIYLYDTRYFIGIIILLFVISGLIGFFFYNQFTFLDATLRKIVERTEGLSTFSLIIFIFLNNLQSALLGMLLGVLIGIPSVINSLINGVVIGYVLRKVYAVSGFSEFWRLLPHGIFELPAIFISLGLGLRFGMFAFKKDAKKEFVNRFFGVARTFVLIVLPLLLIAAIIEGLLIGLYK